MSKKQPRAAHHQPTPAAHPPAESHTAPGTAAAAHAAPGSDHMGLERLVFFSDAVFAIAITLLALEIRLPVPADELTSEGLRATLQGLWPRYLSYAISFMVIGVFWVGHHRKFRYIQRYDNNLLMINLVLLLVVAFVPFPTSVLGETVNQTSVSFYALTIVALGLASSSVWWYAAWRHRLIAPDLDPRRLRRETFQPLFVPAIFLLSVFVEPYDPYWALTTWWLLLPTSLLTR